MLTRNRLKRLIKESSGLNTPKDWEKILNSPSFAFTLNCCSGYGFCAPHPRYTHTMQSQRAQPPPNLYVILLNCIFIK